MTKFNNHSGNFHGKQNGKNGGNFSGDNRKQGGNQNRKGDFKKAKPYAFMPLNKQILYPQDFGEVKDFQISFDKPFAHAQSGEIKFTIIAKSDIFVGDFLGKNSQNSIPKKFFKIGDEFAISGSSVRGVLRTLAEILSFAKLTRTDYAEKRHPNANAQKLDMSERIFGALSNDKQGSNDKQRALKSRVSFSHFIATKVVQTPKFQHPSYIFGGKEMSAKNLAKRNGFKIYTPQGKIGTPNPNLNNPKVNSTLSPLGACSEFTGVLRYFNLTKVELGLLYLCLTCLNSQNGEYFYKFGGAKFYGYGDSHIKLALNAEDKAHLEDCIKAYTDFVRRADSAWRKNAHANTRPNAQNSGFDLDARIQALQSLSKIGGDKGDDTQNSQNSAQNSRNLRQFSSQNSQNGNYNRGYKGYDKGGSHNNGFGSKFDDLLDRFK